ncbi:MAG: redox-sensing transcriptional repressor Rex [Ruminococcaceae bacterium]|nr:redox-sensing transcriptional repressor Rex [Oscillospiraceae bacterium]
MQLKKVSKAMLRRLPGYLDYLKSLPENASANISARTMADALGLGDVLVRKDLAMVSDGGRCKTGHLRETLIKDIEDFLDYNKRADAILIGAGKLGQALMGYDGFEGYGLNILAGFDIAPTCTQTDSGKPIYSIDALEDFCHKNDVRIGIITVPSSHAQQACDMLIACGIKAIWNFAPVHLRVAKHILVQNENLAVSLTALRMQLKGQLNDE